MAAVKKKRSVAKKASVKSVQSRSSVAKKNTVVPSRKARLRLRINNFLSRRPHRTFKYTRRRDYVRSFALPGYISFTWYVLQTLRERTNTFLLLILTFATATTLLVGIGSQETFQGLRDTLSDDGENIFVGGWGELSKAGLLVLTGVQGGFSTVPSEGQQIFATLLTLLTWLTTIWLLRAQLANKTPRLRDALYRAGAPIVSMTLLTLLFVIQLIPAIIAAIGYSAAVSTGFFENGVLSLLFFIIAALLTILTLYLVTSTFMAMVIVTLPGMYPWQALRAAGDLVIGRRLRILLRLLWLVLVVLVTWLIIMIPIVILANWLQSSITQIAWIPIVPIVLVFVSSASVVFVASYVYLLYRKVVDDDTAPA